MKLIDKIEAVNNSINEKLKAIENATDTQEVKDLFVELNALKAEKNTLEKEGTAVTTQVTNYLETEKARKDFVKIFANAKTNEEFKNNWNVKLAENGITVTDDGNYLPHKIELEIQSATIDAHPVYALAKQSDNGGILVAREFTGESGAKVHVRGTKKDSVNTNLKASGIKPQFVYKRTSIDEIDMKAFKDAGEILESIVVDSTHEIFGKIEELMLVSGTATEGETGTAEEENGFVSVLSEKDTNKVKHFNGKSDLIGAVEDAIDSIEVPGKKALIVTRAQKRAILNALRTKFPNAVYRNNNAELAAELGVDEIIIYKQAGEIRPTVMAEGAYAVDMTKLDRIEQFKIDTNENDLLIESLATGRPALFGGIAVVDLA